MKSSKFIKTLLVVMLTVCCVLPSVPVQNVQAEGAQKAGSINNTVVLDDMYGSLMTKEAVNLTVGKKYFLTYTVDSVEKNTLLGFGLQVSKKGNEYGDNGEGFLKHTDSKIKEMLTPGYTYFISYEIEKDGFHYRVIKAKGSEAHYVDLGDVGEYIFGKYITDGRYFGILFNGAEEYQGKKRSITATLTRVRFYDEAGRDLAIQTTGGGKGTIYQPSKFQEKKMDHYYEFSLKDAMNVYVANRDETTADRIYLSFDVKNVERQSVAMNGFVATKDPKDVYPWNRGVLGYDDFPIGESPFLVEGAHYLVVFDRTKEGAEAVVKRTANGQTTVFGWTAGMFTENWDYNETQYFGIFMGQGYESFVTADFKNVKCYDSNGVNLGIQTNQPEVKVMHYGNLEDYSLCAAVYYCKENNTFFILDDKENFGLEPVGEDTTWGTYSIDDTKWKFTGKVGSETIICDYKQSVIVTEDGQTYKRMRDNKVTFVTGEEEFVEVADAENRFRVQKPEDPTKENDTFLYWCLGDGTEYDFDEVVDEAKTVYAKWQNEDGHEYVAMEGKPFSVGAIAVVSVAAVILIASAVTAIVILKKRKEE